MRTSALTLAIATLLSAWPLSAFSRCNCYLPNAPTIPDGSAADSSKMAYAKNQLTSYQSKMASYKQCLEQCLVDADNRENQVVQQWNATVETYNARQASR